MSIWTISSTGRAEAEIDGFAVAVDSADPTTGAHLRRPGAGSTPVLAIRDAASTPLPQRSEFYAREDQFTVNYPQTDASLFGFQLRWTLQRVENLHLLALTIAVQTTLLDCHPTLDVALGGPVGAVASAPASGEETSARSSGEVAPISVIEIEATPPLLLVQRRQDAPFNTLHDESSRDAFLRVFAEFVEKGVIRKTQLWLVLDDHPPAHSDIADLITRLPLPLTA